ncbi:MAG: aldo/keto reductase [Kofleriaceae bacterium]
MRTIALGTGPSVTAVGCGDVSLAVAAARGIDAAAVERAVSDAVERGITIIEVAADLDTEHLVGDVLRTLRARDRVVVAAKIELVPERPGVPHREVLPDRLPSRWIQERVEACLRASRLEVVPLAQLPLAPAWRESSAWPELAGTCARLVREGKVLQWGAIVRHHPEQPPADTALTTEPWLTAFQVVFHLWDRSAEPWIAAAIDHKRCVLARQVLAGGALAGSIGPGVKLALTDDRRSIDTSVLERISVGVAKLAPMVRYEPAAARSSDAAREALDRGRRPANVECATTAELALRFVMDRGVVALPRVHRHEYVSELIAAGSAPPLSRDLLAHLLDDKTALTR